MIPRANAVATIPTTSPAHGSITGGKRINNLSWKIAGAAGDGILNAGRMFAKLCMRDGLYVFASAEYPSLIRGGHNHLDIRVSDKPLASHTKWVDLLVALNQEAVDKHASKIIPGGGIIYDGDTLKVSVESLKRSDIALFPLPLLKTASACGGPIMRNVVAMGATIGLLGVALSSFIAILTETFEKKGDAVVQKNIKAAQAGYDLVKGKPFPVSLKKQPGPQRLFMSGNEAMTAGAIKAGLTFFAAYPMTPASSILHTVAANEKDYNIVVKHTEDEITAINAAIGASYAGARSMTATSGGGFALMVEGLGLAAQTETPLVVANVMRPGPGSGMATHSGQGDLQYVLHASTDEFPRVVVAPGDAAENYTLGFEAFNLADQYQLPVILLSDKYLAESYCSVDPLPHQLSVHRGKMVTTAQQNYKRYALTKDAVSPRARPGIPGCMFVASSYEHDEEGNECEEPAVRVAMHQKRFRKIEQLAKTLPQPKLIGPADAPITFVSWGSPKGPILEAMKLLKSDGVATNFLQLMYLSPFPTETVSRILKKAKQLVLVESNMTSQLGSLIREQCLITIKEKILRYDGRPFDPEDIVAAIKEMIV
ncbi:MAG: 2-oxoacid:acceptor oxidoreductase subunit alpha [Nanoarchaeota archaeon]|nr:2-oxoacid:acceptor oxidoreductase subunit alpha [Nanoarchaeota archaeon]